MSKLPEILGETERVQTVCTRLVFLRPRTRAWERGYLKPSLIPKLPNFLFLAVWKNRNGLAHNLVCDVNIERMVERV